MRLKATSWRCSVIQPLLVEDPPIEFVTNFPGAIFQCIFLEIGPKKEILAGVPLAKVRANSTRGRNSKWPPEIKVMPYFYL
jgi:hypothetical protein